MQTSDQSRSEQATEMSALIALANRAKLKKREDENRIIAEAVRQANFSLLTRIRMNNRTEEVAIRTMTPLIPLRPMKTIKSLALRARRLLSANGERERNANVS